MEYAVDHASNLRVAHLINVKHIPVAVARVAASIGLHVFEIVNESAKALRPSPIDELVEKSLSDQ